MKKLEYKLISIVTISLLIFIWDMLTYRQSPSAELLFPSLHNVIINLESNYEVFLHSMLVTWSRVILGLVIGFFTGLIMGIFITWSQILESVLDPVIELIRPIPPIALTPFFILWFGLGNLGQLLLIALGCFMIIVVSTVTSIRNVNVLYVRAAKSLGASMYDIYTTVLLPSILPNLLSATRVALATGFSLTVAAEYLGAQGGLGYLIRNARVTLSTNTILLAAVLLGVLSLLTDFLIRKLFNYLTRWNNV
ncbi:ABC transporter permease [Tenacibaculum agarivorans]|uniref:ABC transporter permease n=1 Tax=Tenacibaculum agarivorans TaxID=1908389 RepID=UPI00094BAEE8|nr:ABC transporter permease [Tenacibaculum agarivorans]